MFDVEPIETRNVVGILPGTDSIRSSECIVIGSHYDHVGIGKYGAMNRQDVGKIHYGADDNASGTACLMELAAILSEVKLKRSVVFVGFNAEEMGLLGSAYFTNDQPAFPLRQTVAMLNLDMVGRNEDSLLWIAGGFYSPDLMKIIEEENKKVGFVLLYNTGLLNFASDQGPFLRRNIPAAFFFSGLHSDYHTPADTHQKLNYTKMGRVTNLAARCAARLANTETLPKYYEIPLSERIALIKESSQKLQRFRPIKKAQQEALPGAQNEH
jgi:Zn-dependent M28 family amino/carboxypeptidase